jgi:hypothetical protein
MLIVVGEVLDSGGISFSMLPLPVHSRSIRVFMNGDQSCGNKSGCDSPCAMSNS